jgi:radical SAM protein with 4Fe4S-binding SPASM domain
MIDQLVKAENPASPSPIKRPRNRYLGIQAQLFLRGVKTGKINVRKLWNVFLNEVHFLFKTLQGPPAPFILTLELWNECNAGCLFCRDKKGNIRDLNPGKLAPIMKGKMSPEMATEIIGQLKDDLLTAVLYTTGEPFLYPELGQVVRFATDNKVTTVIASNGLMMTEEKVRDVLEAGIDLIKIQLSGWTQDIYSIQIRYGEVERLKENIRMLARINQEGNYGTIILIDYILYNYNKHQLPFVKEFCRELGLNLNLRPGNPAGGLEKLEPVVPEQLPLKISCDYLWKAMQVNFNGDIFPCCEATVWSGAKPYEVFRTGKTKVREVWRGKSAQAWRHMMNTKGRAAEPMCAQCNRRSVCFKV